MKSYGEYECDNCGEVFEALFGCIEGEDCGKCPNGKLSKLKSAEPTA